MYNENEIRWEKIKALFHKVVPYFIDFYSSIAIGLFAGLVLGIPFAFFRDINMDVVHFLFGFAGMCITLYRRSFRRGYHANSRTYTFSLKDSVRYIAICFAAQMFLVILVGAHTVYITGPVYWITQVVFPGAYRSEMGGHFLREGYDWLLMFLEDGLVVGPIMVFAEYIGSKERKKDYQL